MDKLYKPKKEIYVLSGIIECMACGEIFSSYVNGRHRYYRCTGYTKKRNCPYKSKTVNAKLIESVVFEKMVERCMDITFPNFMEKLRGKMEAYFSEIQQYINFVSENKENMNTLDFYDVFFEFKKKSGQTLESLNEYHIINSSLGHESLAKHLIEFDQKELKNFYKKEISINFNVEKGEGVINFIYRDEEPITFSLKPVEQSS